MTIKTVNAWSEPRPRAMLWERIRPWLLKSLAIVALAAVAVLFAVIFAVGVFSAYVHVLAS